jgi:hypothetical protein
LPVRTIGESTEPHIVVSTISEPRAKPSASKSCTASMRSAAARMWRAPCPSTRRDNSSWAAAAAASTARLAASTRLSCSSRAAMRSGKASSTSFQRETKSVLAIVFVLLKMPASA